MWSAKIRKFAIQRLDGYSNQRSLRRITGSLKDTDLVMRLKAIDGLYEAACTWKSKDLPSYKRACGAFVLAMKDPDATVRLRCVERLKALASDPQFPELGLLLLALRDRNPEVRELAARACLESNNLPMMMEALKISDGEVRKIIASGIGDDIFQRLQRIDAFDRWSRGLHSVRGKPAPAGDSPEDRSLYLRDKAMEREMLRFTSNAVVAFLKSSGNAGVAEEVFTKAFRVYHASDPRFIALSQLAFAIVNQEAGAAETGIQLLQGGDINSLLRPYMDDDPVPSGGVAPRCDTCSKELESLDLSGIPEALKSDSLALYAGVVCSACRKVECTDCKGSPGDAPCKWCGRRTVLAHSQLL